VKGRIVSVTVQPWGSVPTLQCELRDETGSVLVAFLGRRRIPGIAAGNQMEIVGTAGEHYGRLVVINPDYHLVGTTGTD
jgi:RecJ-like exonuclease